MTTIYSNIKLYGPYKSKKDGRLRVVLVDVTGKKKTVSYPKYLMECHLDRYLTIDETVDHKDRNFDNNNIDNLQILIRSKHSSLDAKRVKPVEFTCTVCTSIFIIEGSNRIRDAVRNRKNEKSGPYCSRRCAGIDSHNENRITHEVDREYFYMDKQL